MSNLVAYLNWTPTSEKYLFLVWFQEECQKDMYLIKYEIVCSKCDNDFRFNNQHNERERVTNDHIMSTRIFTLIVHLDELQE